MRHLQALLAFPLLVLTLTACPKKDNGQGDAAADASASAPSASASAAAVPRKPGAMPWAGFVSQATTAKKDDYVLVPSGNWIDDSFTKGADKTTFIYYAAKVLEPGPLDTKVKSLAGTEFTAPNGFIIPLKPAQKAKPGDIVLTWWQSGSGMQRSIIVAGGTEEEPKALHLDISYDNPAKIAQKEDTLKKGSFHKLSNTLEPGVTVAVKDGSSYRPWTVTAVSGDQVLGIGFAGTMKMFKKSECILINPQGTFAAGADVGAVSISSFGKAKVDHVEAKIGRVFVKIGTDTKLVGAGLPSVAPAALLPGMN